MPSFFANAKVRKRTDIRKLSNHFLRWIDKRIVMYKTIYALQSVIGPVKKFYNRPSAIKKVPLYDEKSGTLLIEKRYFTSRKTVLFVSQKHKTLCIRRMRINTGLFGIYFTNSPVLRSFKSKQNIAE